MLFRRRQQLPWWRRAASWIWPRGGLKRTLIYYWYRMLRLPGTTHSIAAGMASGMAVSFTPFLGLHFILAFMLAVLLRGNLIAAAIGTAVGNPWTFPLIFSLTGSVGSLILDVDISSSASDWSWDAFYASPSEYLYNLAPVLTPYALGSIPFFVTVWFIGYFGFKQLLERYKLSRRARQAERKLQEMEQADGK